MQPSITRVDATLGAIVTNVNLAALDTATFHQIEKAFHDHAVLLFPEQHLDDEAQVAFAARFGAIELLAPDPALKAVPISNRKRDGSVLAASEHGFQALRGNEGWHTDSSYMPLSAKASVLSAQIVPAAGGETEFADMRAAYEALDADMRRRIGTLCAHHSLYQSQARIGHIVATGTAYGYHTKGAPLRPLVKVHPVTGRPALYIGRHAYGIAGLTAAESEKLLDDLVDFACQAPRTYAHRWQPGDVVIWDNRCVLHRARPYDYNAVRVMRHTRVAGDPATELAPTERDERAADFQPSAANR